jgi:hypothetical protein
MVDRTVHTALFSYNFREIVTLMKMCAPPPPPIMIIIGSTALGVPWSPEANVASDLYPVQPSVSLCNPVSLRLLPRKSILFSVGHVIVDLKGLSIIGNSLSSIRTT